jgi:hypothetical protein
MLVPDTNVLIELPEFRHVLLKVLRAGRLDLSTTQLPAPTFLLWSLL